MSTSSNASPRVPRPAALSDDMDYEDKHMFPPSRRSHLGSPIFSRRSVHSVHSTSSSVENSPAAPSGTKSYTNSPLKTRHSESELLVSPRNRSELDEYPRFDSKKKMSADFSDDTMSVGSIGGGESPKSDKGSWRIRSAVAGPFLTGPLAKDFQSEHLKTPRGKARDDMNFDHSGLMFPLAPVLDAIPDTPRGGYHHQPQGFTDISQYENSSQPMDGFNLDHSGYVSNEPARPAPAFNSARRTTNSQSQEAMLNSQYYAGYDAQGAAQGGFESSQQQSTDGHLYNGAPPSSAIVATQSNNSHAANYADVVARNGGGSNEQSLVSSSGNDSLESLSKGMADSMAQILAKTKNGRSFGEVQLTTLVQKIHLHMNIMGRTSAAIREDYNRIKAKLEQTITDKKVLEATNYHLQQLVQQYEVERQYFHQYVLHSLQSQSSLIYESMGNLSQNVAQSKYTIEELSARLSRELSNIQGSRGNDSQLKEVLEEIKRAVDISSIAGAQQGETRSQSPARTSQSAAKAGNDTKNEESKAGGFKLTPVLLAVLLWIATLGGVYFSAKSAALSELQQQPSTSILPSDLDLIVDQISQKLESAVQASEVRKLVYTELKENPQIVESVVGSAGNGLAEEIAQRLDEEAKVEHDSHHSAPEAAAPSEPSVSVSEQASEVVDEQKTGGSAEAEVTPNAELNTEIVKEEVPAKSEEPVAPAEMNANVPADAVPPVVDAVAEAESSIVEIEVPPVDVPAYPDSLIAELLHLNPTDDKPFDNVGEGLDQPVVDVIDNTENEVATDEVYGETKTEVFTESSLDPLTLDERSTQPIDVEDIAPVIKADNSEHLETSEDVIEIAIESAVNLDLIVQKEQLVHDNATLNLEPDLTEQGIITNPLEQSVSTEDDAPEAVGINDVMSIDVNAEADDSAAKTEADITIEPVEVSLDANQVVSPADEEDVKEVASLIDDEAAVPGELEKDVIKAASVSDEEVKTQQNEDKEASLLYETSAVLAEIEEASFATSENQEVRVSEDNISTSGDIQPEAVQAQADDAASEDAGVSTEDAGAATAFAGLSMALKSLANRFVEGFDASKPTEAIAGVFSSSQLSDTVSETVDGHVPAPSKTVKFTDEHTETTEIGDKTVESVDAEENPEVVVKVPVAAEPFTLDVEGKTQVDKVASQSETVLAIDIAESAQVASEATNEPLIVDVGDIIEPSSDAVQAKEADKAVDAAKDPTGDVEMATSLFAEPRVEEIEVEAKPTEPASDDDQSKEVVESVVSSDDTSEVKADLLISAADKPRGESELNEVAHITRHLTEVDDAKVGSIESEKIDDLTAGSLSVEVGEEITKGSSDDAEHAGSLDLDSAGMKGNSEVAGAESDGSTDQSTEVSEPTSELNVDSSSLSAESPAEETVEQVVITEAIDVEGNIVSPAGDLDLGLLSEQASEPATGDEIVASGKNEEKAADLTVAVSETEDASLPVETPASTDVLVEDSIASSDTSIATKQPSAVDEQAGDAIMSVGDIGSPVAIDAIGSVEAVDPSESLTTTSDEAGLATAPNSEPEQLKSGSDVSDADAAVELGTAGISDSAGEDVVTLSEEPQSELQLEAAIEDVSVSLKSGGVDEELNGAAELGATTRSSEDAVPLKGDADKEAPAVVDEEIVELSKTEVDTVDDMKGTFTTMDSSDESLPEVRSEEQPMVPVTSEPVLTSSDSVDGDALEL